MATIYRQIVRTSDGQLHLADVHESPYPDGRGLIAYISGRGDIEVRPGDRGQIPHGCLVDYCQVRRQRGNLRY